MPLQLSTRRTLQSYGFTPQQAARIKRLAGGESLEAIRTAALAPNLPVDAREFLQLAELHIIGTTPVAHQVVVGGGVLEMAAVQFTKLAALPKTGSERPELLRLRANMQDALLGQEHTGALEACVAGYNDFLKPLRQTPPLVAIAALPGHGLEQLVEGFSHAAFGKAPLSLAAGALSTTELQQLAASGGGVVHIHCDAATDASGLAAALTATRRSPTFAHVIYVVSFTGEPGSDARDALKRALGSQVASCISGDACLDRLGPVAMREYAVRYLDGLFSDVFPQHRLTLEPGALEALGQLLATPHRPLGEPELGSRIERLVFGRFNEQDLEYPDGALLEVVLASRYQDPQTFQQLQHALHQEDVRLTDFDDVFLVAEKGALQLLDPARIELHERLLELTELAISQSSLLTGTDAAAAFEHLTQILRVLVAEVRVAQGTRSRFVVDSRLAELAEACTTAATALGPLLQHDDDTTRLVAAAAHNVAQASAGWLSDVLQLKNEPASLRDPPPVPGGATHVDAITVREE